MKPQPKPLLTSAAVMKRLGYKCKPTFWKLVYSQGVPHIRLNARRIMFDEDELNAWLASRTSRGIQRTDPKVGQSTMT